MHLSIWRILKNFTKKSSSTLDFNIDFDSELIINKKTTSNLFLQLKSMALIRAAEVKIAKTRKTGEIGGPVHLGAGQEAIAVGVAKYLSNHDYVFSGHRSHAHLLAMGTDLRKLFAEILGKSTGLTKGAGGSMHLWDGQRGFHGSVPIVAGSVSLAAGAGLASRLQGRSNIAVSYFGDGAIEEGVVHETLNLARQIRIPILFVCENNLFSSHMHISQRQPKISVSRFAVANDIKVEVVDGNNLIAVDLAARKLIDIARKTSTPVFIEAFTYRHFGHVDWQEDIDVGVNRSKSDLAKWKKRDPIKRLEIAMLKNELVSNEDLSKLNIEIDNYVAECWKLAKNDPEPEPFNLLQDIYKK